MKNLTDLNWTRIGLALALGLGSLSLIPQLGAQTDAAFKESPDTHYYDFWPGTWVEVIDGKVAPSGSQFMVERSVHPAAYEEKWIQVYDGEVHPSRALRTWDQVHQRWTFAWVSDNALFQVWPAEKVGDTWYHFKNFEIDGQTIQSRQSIRPRGDHQVVWTLQRSTDGGKSWTTRYETIFQKASSVEPKK